MSVFYVVQWSVNPQDQEACEQEVKALAEHVKSVHPPIKCFRAYSQSFGRLPQLTYFAVGEYESMTAVDNDPDLPSCEAVWAPIYNLAQTGSIAMSLWSDSQRESWFER
jgi:hypothetical protein